MLKSSERMPVVRSTNVRFLSLATLDASAIATGGIAAILAVASVALIIATLVGVALIVVASRGRRSVEVGIRAAANIGAATDIATLDIRATAHVSSTAPNVHASPVARANVHAGSNTATLDARTVGGLRSVATLELRAVRAALVTAFDVAALSVTGLGIATLSVAAAASTAAAADWGSGLAATTRFTAARVAAGVSATTAAIATAVSTATSATMLVTAAAATSAMTVTCASIFRHQHSHSCQSDERPAQDLEHSVSHLKTP